MPSQEIDFSTLWLTTGALIWQMVAGMPCVSRRDVLMRSFPFVPGSGLWAQGLVMGSEAGYGAELCHVFEVKGVALSLSLSLFLCLCLSLKRPCCSNHIPLSLCCNNIFSLLSGALPTAMEINVIDGTQHEYCPSLSPPLH